MYAKHHKVHYSSLANLKRSCKEIFKDEVSFTIGESLLSRDSTYLARATLRFPYPCEPPRVRENISKAFAVLFEVYPRSTFEVSELAS